jgi:hypothetical protein
MYEILGVCVFSNSGGTEELSTLPLVRRARQRLSMDLSLSGQSRRCGGAASRRPLRSWRLGRRSGRVPALPYPPPRWPQCIAPRWARQRRSPWPRLAAACRPSPIRLSWGTREPPQPAEFRAGVMSATTRRARNGPGVPAQALAAEPSVGLLPGGARAFGCHGSLPYKHRNDYTYFFSSRSSMSRYWRTRAKLHCSA